MRRFYWPALLLSVALLAPIVPFLWLGEEFERRLTDFFDPPPPAALTSAALAGVMATDIFLPVPSSLLTVIAGAQLGRQLGAPAGLTIAVTAAWVGLTLGGAIGFSITRRWGRGVAARFASAHDLERMDRMADRYGVLAIIISRPLPLLAEATVLVLGTTSLSWQTFLPTLLLSNLGLGVGYAALGYFGAQQGQLVWAMMASVALPAVATGVARLIWRPALAESRASRSENRRELAHIAMSPVQSDPPRYSADDRLLATNPGIES